MSRIKKYSITLEYKNGRAYMTRECDGFDAIELLGMLEKIQLEIMQQMAGHIKTDIVSRKVIEEGIAPDQKPLPDLGKGSDAKD